MDWIEAQHQDELMRQAEILEALHKAEEQGVPPEIINLLAYECGVGEQMKKEIRK